MLSTIDFSFFNLVLGHVYSSIDDFVSQKAIFINDHVVNKMLNQKVIMLQPSRNKSQISIIRQRANNSIHLNHNI
jgi:hypothetical protein